MVTRSKIEEAVLERGRRQRTLDRVPDELVDATRVAEAHFDLLRMDIDVDAPWIDGEP